jgi:microsomal epoxide hydrolase
VRFRGFSADLDLVNLFIGVQGEVEGLSEKEQVGLGRYENFGTMGNAYARMHGTRPATIGLVLSSSPIALLAW